MDNKRLTNATRLAYTLPVDRLAYAMRKAGFIIVRGSENAMIARAALDELSPNQFHNYRNPKRMMRALETAAKG